jgi:hypothetical protein
LPVGTIRIVRWWERRRRIRDQVPTLVHGLTGHIPLSKALKLVKQAISNGCSIPQRQTRLSTLHLLLKQFDDGLT